MKRFVQILFLLITLALPSMVLADSPAPGGPFTTAFRIQNLGNGTATCVIKFYDGAGVEKYSMSPSGIAVGDSLLVFTPNESGLTPGSYSGVVSCDQEVVAVVNFSDSNSGASHNGVSGTDAAATWYAPGIYNNYFGFYSNIYVQNAASGPVDITVEYFAPGSATAVSTQTETNVPQNASVIFDQSSNASLVAGVAYSAKVTSTGGNVAPIVNIYGLGSADNQLYSYNPFTAGSTVAYAPVIMNSYFGYNTALTVQNIDSAAANVTVTYGSGQTETATIAAGASKLFYTPTSGVPAGQLTGAKVESTNGKQIVALVNESNGFNRAASYSAFAQGAKKVNAPIVMKRYFGFNSSVTCQNIGVSAATIKITYGGGGVTNTSSSIAPNQTTLFYQPNEASLTNSYINSAVIESAQDIVCVVNQDINEGSGATTVQDQLYAYDGIGQ